MNFRIVWKMLGQVLWIETALLLAPLITAAVYGENPHPFVLTMLLTAAAGCALFIAGRKASGSMHAREGFVTVALSWILISLFGALPFVFSGAIPNYIDAFFEIVSGFTTTGSSILTEIQSLPRGVLFWRSFSHWIGGMGVLVFMMAVLPMDNGNSMHLLRAEVPGPVKGKLMPRMRATAATLYIIYCVLTVIEIIFLLCGGMPLYDALVNSFGTAGTGGFSVLNSSIGGYNSVYAEMVIAVFMLLFGINFNLYAMLLMRRSLRAFKSEELFVYLGIVAFATVTIALNIVSTVGSLGQSLRYSFFQVSSIITTTGYGTADFNQWPAYSRMMLVLLMILGACAGSTGGGMKVSRVLIVMKQSWADIRHQLFPRAVRNVRIDGQRLEEATVRSTLTYCSLYAIVTMLCCLLLSLEGLDFETTVTSVIACLSNIGPGLGLVGPAGNFSVWGYGGKLLLSACMLLGRLEFFPMIMLFTPGVWVRQKK